MATSKKNNPGKTVLISLVSEQTLPNVLFIKQFGASASTLCFLNTERFQTEGRSTWIRQAAKAQSKAFFEIPLDPEDPIQCLEALDEVDWTIYDDFIINLTGGTKMMALAVHSFFSARFEEKTSIYYIPIYQNQCVEIFPESKKIELTAQVNVMEYLESYGIQVLQQNNYHRDKRASELAGFIFQKLVLEENPYTLEKIQHAAEITDHFERKIYQGEWLEIWLANQIHRVLQIPTSQILQGIRMNKPGMPDTANSEFDVLFQWKNRLYVGECKFYNGGKFKMSGSTGTSRDIFKLGNLKNNLGLHAVPFIVTANSTQKVREFGPACQFYGIHKIADQRLLKDKAAFDTFIGTLGSK
jgi:hypothetical protein